MILDGVKYEIGKRYHSEIEFKNNIYDFNSDLLANMKDLDVFVNIEERNFSLEIIDKQYGDHLRLLRHNKNIAVSEKAKKIIDECELN